MCADLVHLGRAGEAAAHCTQGLKMRPEYVMARINLGMAFALQGRQVEAERELNLALREDPGNPTARQVLLNLRSRQLR